MTKELKEQLDLLEAEYAELKIAMDEYRKIYEAISEKVSPLLAKRAEVEKAMDLIKPRFAELESRLAHLRKAVN